MERSSVVTTFLVGCLTLGFFSLFSVYLPSQLSQAGGTPGIAPMASSQTAPLSDLVYQLPPLPPPQKPPESMALVAGIPYNDNPERLATTAKRHRNRPAKKRAPLPKEVPYHPLKPYEPLEKMPKRHYSHGFFVTESLRPAVEFWRNVYARYELNTSILHDNRHMNIVYGILDFSSLDENLMLSPETKKSIRSAVEEKKRGELAKMLLRFQAGEQPKTAGEHVVYRLFEKVRGADKFAKAAGRIRGQWGQKDRFQEGLVRAGRYMPMMEEIFIREGAPREITRLVFVESMFNLNAFSKVGAGGPWQFMPATARLYMTMNKFVDERRDPLIAAQGAARLLLKNYEQVKSWPLAINGYNTGILRMARAVNRLGTRDIATIIERFDDPGYQFASRNFYPEFLAALEVADHHKDYFGELEFDSPVPFDQVVLPYPVSLSRLAELTATDIEILRDLNPSYHENAFVPNALLPKGYTINVPHRQRMLFLAALNQIHNQEKEVRFHIAGKGETLQQIAAQHDIPVSRLKAFNGMVGNRIQAGQILKIPGLPEKVVLKAAE